MKMPPKEKIPEAYSAIADGRVHIGDDNTATVRSSDGAKTYTVKWQGDTYTSDDNATYWQGYPGYPVLAVLMLQKKLPYDPAIAPYFVGINWHSLNSAHKRNYAAALNEALENLNQNERQTVDTEIDKCFESLKHLDLTIKRKIS